MISLCVMALALITAIYAGYKKGMIKIILSCLSLLITMLIIAAIAPRVTSAVKDSNVYESIASSTEKSLSKQGVFEKSSDDKIINALKLPVPVKEKILENKTAKRYAQMGVSDIRQYVVHSLTDVILTAIVYIILFVIVFALVNVFIGVFDIVGKLPILKQFNQLGGAAIGFLEGLLFIWLALLIISAFGNTEFATWVYNDIASNSIAKFIYDNNLFLKLIASAI